MKWAMGIDNGLKGAIVVITENFDLLDYADTPVISLKGKTKTKKNRTKTEYAPVEMKKLVEHTVKRAAEKKAALMVWIEQATAMPKQGLSSTFKTGYGFGLWEGICLGLGLKYDIVRPSTWTKTMLFDIPRGDPKARSMMKCQRLFPDLPLKKPQGHVLSLDGRSDAALLAYYGMLQMLGGHNLPETYKIKKTPPRIR